MCKTKWLICVVGPTGIGKTALGISLAKYFETEIISADSRQFYKEMRIGTAVPTEEELASVPHHFIQHLSIHDSYSVGDFENDAIELLDKIFQEKDIVIMVGGSGLYVDAVVKGLDRFPAVDPSVREKLIQELESHGLERLQQELKTMDPLTYDSIDLNNKHRLIRALEVCRASGLPFSSFKSKNSGSRNFNACYIGLTAERPVVYRRIEQRVDRMISEGLEMEARKLFPYRDLNALKTVGYKELFAYFEGRFTKEEAIEEIKKNTRRFAKRQGTWYRKNEQVMWFDYRKDHQDIISSLPIKKGR